MAIFWFVPPACFPLQQKHQIIDLPDSIRVTANSQTLKRTEHVAEFEGLVIATYGVTKLRGDRITFFMPPSSSSLFLKRATAIGNVTLEDPLGTIFAQRIEFDWETGKGLAIDAFVIIGGMEVKVDEIEIQPSQWILKNVTAKICEDNHLGFSCKKLVYQPSQQAEFFDAQLKFFGKTFLGFKKQQLSLAPESRSAIWPDIVLGGSRGIGVQWKGRYGITNQLNFATNVGTASNSKPWGEMYLIQGFLLSDNQIRTPRSDRSEVASQGYFENINVPDPESEITSERQRRGSISLGTSWNRGKFADTAGDFNTPYELIVEGGGNVSKFGWFAQIRAHRLDQKDADDMDRLVGLATLSFPKIELTKNVSLGGRVDARQYVTKDSGQGGWIRGQLGLVGTIGNRVRLGIAYSDSDQFGEPPLSFESLESERAICFRADFGNGATKINTLFKYDPDGKDWYGHEFSIRQTAGCIEPFVSYRSRQRRITFGFTLRPLEKIERIEETAAKRLIGNHLPP